MPGRYMQSQNKNRSRFYILLSVVLIIIIIKWGIPLFMNMVAGNVVVVKPTQKDIFPPQVPILSALPEATNSASVEIDGYTEKDVSVELLLNDVVDKTSKADDSGNFSLNSSLKFGQNRIQVRAKDAAGNESLSDVELINYDNKPITLTISSPADGSEYFGKVSQVVDIKGSIDKTDGQVTVNNSFVQVGHDGSFDYSFPLSSGDNNITVSATDKAGNQDQKTFKLTYTP